MNQMRYLIVTDYLESVNGEDVSDVLQRIIDENPNRTIYFPDGVYLLSKPIATPADPRRSVDLVLSNFATLKASDSWSSDDAMIRLGGIHPASNIRTCGSNYGLRGGIIDGNGCACGISIESGRETAVQNVSIKHTRIGLHIKYGANCGSSDADITNVNIVGNGASNSVGVLVEGFDNTFTNMRIADVFIGVNIRSSGNMFRNIHPLFTLDFELFDESCGFYDCKGSNFFDYCYSDNFGYAFREADDIQVNVYQICFCFWYSPKGARHVAFKCDGQFKSVITNYKIGFYDGSSENVILEADKEGGEGVLDRVIADLNLINNYSHKAYLKEPVVNFVQK